MHPDRSPPHPWKLFREWLIDYLTAQVAMTSGEQRFDADADWWATRMLNVLGR
jgi:hypothetical protein